MVHKYSGILNLRKFEAQYFFRLRGDFSPFGDAAAGHPDNAIPVRNNGDTVAPVMGDFDIQHILRHLFRPLHPQRPEKIAAPPGAPLIRRQSG
jgi:hypothetical protein